MSLLQFHQASRHFGRRTVLDGLALDVQAGERIALTGANGSGKTTLLRLAAGTLRPTAGHVERNADHMAFLPQDAPVYRELSPMDHLRFATKVRRLDWNRDHAISELRDAGLARQSDQPAGQLSRGQRQRLHVVLANFGNPDLLLLDEPATALDADGLRWLRDVLASSNAAVLAAVHDAPPFTPNRTLHLQGGRIA